MTELQKLQQENAELKKRLEIADDIERHKELFVTRKSGETKTKYCSRCFDAERKLIQVDCSDSSGKFKCPNCKTGGIYDQEKSRKSGEALFNALTGNIKPM